MAVKLKMLNNSDLIPLIAEHSGYYRYEISDILQSLAVVVSYAIKEGHDVRIKGLGTFSYKKPRPCKNYSPYTGRYMDTMTKAGCKFKPDKLFSNLLNMSNEEFIKLTTKRDKNELGE